VRFKLKFVMTTPRMRFHLDDEIDESVRRWTSPQCESPAGVSANNHPEIGCRRW
jgi:hypothetical protein